MEHEEIGFDENDKNLFQVDDMRLRADALRHSILPRLHVLMNKCISTIKHVYNINVLEDSIVSFFPHFRQDRTNELKVVYESAYVGLGGKRIKNKWHGLEKKDGRPVQIVPFRFGFDLSEEGLVFLMSNYWVKGLTDTSYRKYLDFHLEFEELTHILCYFSEMSPVLHHGNMLNPISTFGQYYHHMIKNRFFDNTFISQYPNNFPILSESLAYIIEKYVLFFPIYDSYIQISKGQPIRFLELISKANFWLLENKQNENVNYFTASKVSEESILRAREAAEQRVKVMPAIRWQVFQRDNWKCVACGRGSQDDVILHVDHIVPRSKGGKDTLENFQTLCNVCNLGKSNKDSTDLRLKT